MREELIKARENLGLTQLQVAMNVGISRSFYGLIETGNRNPSYGLAKRIAKELKKNAEALFFDLDGFEMKRKEGLKPNPPAA